jgi:hypothetical protein
MNARVRLFCQCVLIVAATDASAQVFRDDFNGTSLDSNAWSLDPGDGQAVVVNGELVLSCSGRVFPVVTSIRDIFPAGDFVVRVGMRYLQQSFCGDGFGAMDNFWENYHTGIPCRPFLLWQDTGGLYTYTGSAVPTFVMPGAQTTPHVFQWAYVAGRYEFSMDGVIHSWGDCAPRATTVFFGHPHPIGCSPWTSFAVDFIEIGPLELTAAKSLAWGSLKQIYR